MYVCNFGGVIEQIRLDFDEIGVAFVTVVGSVPR